MSPEQARAQKDVDHRADLWATGVIAYRMITGTLPFPGEVLGEVLSSVLVDPFPPMAQVAPDLPAAFDGFFARALAKKKQERFSSVAELLEAFAAASGAGPSPGFASEITGHSTAPTLEPHLPLAAEPVAVPVPVPVASFAPVVAQAPPGPPGPAAQPMGQPGASQSAPRRPASVTDTTAPTQVYRPSSPVLETAPFAMPSEQGAGERTGPSIANATSSLFPDVAPPRRGRTTLLVIGAAALAALVVALVFFGRSSSSGSGGPDASASSNASATGNSTGGAPESPPTAEPTLAPPPAAPTAEASVQFVPPEPTSSAKAVATAALSSGPLKAVSTSPPRTTAAPTGTAAPKKRRDWGLN
jgi:serine/threonine-protein kinase